MRAHTAPQHTNATARTLAMWCVSAGALPQTTHMQRSVCVCMGGAPPRHNPQPAPWPPTWRCSGLHEFLMIQNLTLRPGI